MKPKKASNAAKNGTSRNMMVPLKPQLVPLKRDGDHSTNSTNCSLKTNGKITSSIKTFAHICSGCNKPIKRDKYLLKACDKYWHENCLKCDRCHSRLGELGSTLYFKSNMNLCRQDYLEMFGQTGVCSMCEKLICASEMVMRAKDHVYHLECFACQLCNQRFCVGDRFYLCDNKVVCQFDYEEHLLPRLTVQQSYLEEANGSMMPQADSSVQETAQLDSTFEAAGSSEFNSGDKIQNGDQMRPSSTLDAAQIAEGIHLVDENDQCKLSDEVTQNPLAEVEPKDAEPNQHDRDELPAKTDEPKSNSPPTEVEGAR